MSSACIALHSGAYYHFLEPEKSDYTIEDVAHNLSKIDRFAGASAYQYSVAQHSINASRLVSEEFALEALLHDGAEAFFGDMTTHLKALCPDYKALLHRGERELAHRFGVPLEMSEEVKLADLQMLKLEKSILHKEGGPGWAMLDDIPTPCGKHLWMIETPWRLIKKRFLNRYEELTP